MGADSLDAIELIMEFEKAFGICIPDDQAEKINTVADAVEYIEIASIMDDSCITISNPQQKETRMSQPNLQKTK